MWSFFAFRRSRIFLGAPRYFCFLLFLGFLFFFFVRSPLVCRDYQLPDFAVGPSFPLFLPPSRPPPPFPLQGFALVFLAVPEAKLSSLALRTKLVGVSPPCKLLTFTVGSSGVSLLFPNLDFFFSTFHSQNCKLLRPPPSDPLFNLSPPW